MQSNQTLNQTLWHKSYSEFTLEYSSKNVNCNFPLWSTHKIIDHEGVSAFQKKNENEGRNNVNNCAVCPIQNAF